MEIITKQISELKPYAKNNKAHPAKQIKMIADSINQFGFKNPIIIDKDNEIIAGHGRLLGAKQLGMETVPCIIADDLSEEQVRAYRLLDNRIGDFGEYDIESIMDELKDIGDMQLGLDSLDDLFTDLLPDKENEEAKEDDYEIPDEVKTDIVLGDLFEIGEHRLLCGNSTDAEQVALLMNGEKADMVFTDPPYGISVVNAGSKKVGGGGLTKFKGTVGGSNYVEAKQYSEIIGDDTTDTARKFYQTCVSLGMENFIIWGGNYFTDFLKPSMCWIVWDKENTGNFADVEMAWTSFNKGAKLYKWLWNGMSRKGSKEVEGKTRVHPTQKPVGLFGDIFNDFQFETCFDGFLGSGSTMIASHQLKRKCYGMELDPKYCQVIIDRMIKLDPTLEIKKNGLSYNPIDNG